MGSVARGDPKNQCWLVSLAGFFGEASPYDAKATPHGALPDRDQQIVRVQQPESPAALALDRGWRGKP